MRVADSFPKIYVLGPPSSGKSTFIQKFFSKEIMMFENLIVESSVMEMPSNASKIFLILPNRDALAARQGTDNADSDYFQWLNFYAKNKAKIDIKWTKEF